ncbi:zinc metalloproteinase nas-13-like [Biomphalaria glabrata]|uniref:Metalloendopeptidase n=1 Tax=Biomphalaria glabrata TaxID=6526 RepID=A0A9W3B340_BIOGL|nr:zinc metalloproteinase nas-13-like [Biomphalaria glabrata]
MFNKLLTLISVCYLCAPMDSMTIEKLIYDAATDPQMFDFYHVMPEGDVKVMTEYDLLLTLEQYKKLYSGKRRSKRKAVNQIASLWRDCEVNYEVTSSLSQLDEEVIQQAIQEWEKYTCLVFKNNSRKPNRIQFKDGAGCYSQLGMQNTPQPISLARGCRTKWIVAHEIGHAIGWYHEHMRPDRDRYIQINWNAIPARYHEQYKLYTSNEVNTYNVSYDYQSVMHYGATILPGSITTLDPNYQNKIGQREGFSFKDIKLANLMYKCSMGCLSPKCPYNGFVLSKSFKTKPKCTCWCDSGNITDPLIPCADIDNEMPQPLPISPTKAPLEKKCLDIRKDCAKLKSEDKCMSQIELMMDVCAKTCEFCGKGGGLCMDHEKGCRIIAAAGMCKEDGLVELMKSLCPASCGYCKEISDPCTVQLEMMGPSRSSANLINSYSSYFIFTFLILRFI